MTTLERLERIAHSHCCPDCRDSTNLVVRWNGQKRRDEVVCHGCQRTSGFERRKSLTQVWRENPRGVPIEIANRLAAKHHKEIAAVADGLPPELADIVRQKYGVTQ